MRHEYVLQQAPLGKASTYISEYQPDLLFTIPRSLHREEINIPSELPFYGHDIWNAFEVSWLNPKGKPMVACAEFSFPCTTTHLIESKSFKLYLNSFNNTSFATLNEVEKILTEDLSKRAGAPVSVKLTTIAETKMPIAQQFDGINLDNLDVSCDKYNIHPSYLFTEPLIVTENLHSDLLKSNCLVTGQPDWASVNIKYTGKKINHEGLLQYIVSFRNHNEFHEQCVERMFMDIMRNCQPEKLMVYARYTRRGGLDINPLRANYEVDKNNTRLIRQ